MITLYFNFYTSVKSNLEIGVIFTKQAFLENIALIFARELK